MHSYAQLCTILLNYAQFCTLFAHKRMGVQILKKSKAYTSGHQVAAMVLGYFVREFQLGVPQTENEKNWVTFEGAKMRHAWVVKWSHPCVYFDC